MDRRLDPVDELIDIAREAQACGDHETALQALRRASGLAPMRHDIRRRLAEVLDGAGRVRAAAAREAEFRQSPVPRRASASVFAAPGARSADPAWDGYGAIDDGPAQDSAPREGLLQSLVRRLSFGAANPQGERSAEGPGDSDGVEPRGTESHPQAGGFDERGAPARPEQEPAAAVPPAGRGEPDGPGATVALATAFSGWASSAAGAAAKGVGSTARASARSGLAMGRLARRPGLRGWALATGYSLAIGYVTMAVVQSNRVLSRTGVAGVAAPSVADGRDARAVAPAFPPTAPETAAPADDEGNAAPAASATVVAPSAGAADTANQPAVAAARAALSQGKLDEAAKLFPEGATSADAAELRTDLAAALDRKGTEALEASNFEKAVGYHQKAVKVSGERGTRFLYHLGNALLYAARDAKGEKAARPKLESAADALQRCVKADPSHDLAWAALGDALTKLDRTTDAAAAYRKGLAAVTETIKTQGANPARNARLAKLKDKTGAAKPTPAQRADTKPATAKVTAN